MQGLLETIAACPFTIFFFKFCYETFRGKRNPHFFLKNPTFFRKSNFFLKHPIFFLENPNFIPKIRSFFLNLFSSQKHEIQGFVLVHILLFENIRNPVFGHFPSFPASSFMPRVTYLQYLTQCDVKPGLYSVVRRRNCANESTQIRA